LFTTVNPVKTVRFIAENLTFDCSSADGNVGISVNNAAATDTILRITNTETGIKISTAGA
jgi:protein subunit release factor A